MSNPTVAILGASSDQAKFGNISIRAHAQQGYTVYPVNPRESEINGLPCFSSLADIPAERVDRISVYLPPRILVGVLDEIAKIPHDQLWLNPGTESDAVRERAEELGLKPMYGCSIVDLGISPADVQG